MVLIIDNYDSFTYNLVQYVGTLGYNIEIFKNDEISIQDIEKISPEKIIISPGPGHPKNAGISIDVIKKYYMQIPILGICLGHQAIAIALGGSVVHSNEISHGKVVKINRDGSQIFEGVPDIFKATRYHSLIISKDSLPESIKIIAHTDNDIIMAIEHLSYPLFGLQFHPESIETQFGMQMIENFLSIKNESA